AHCFFPGRRRHTRSKRDWSSDVCSSDLVRVGNSGPLVKTDSAGVFVAQNVTPGFIAIEVRQIGFEPGTFDIRIPESGVVQGVFPLDFNGFMLPAVVVEARAVALMPRYTDFERRRKRKMGAYLRWD